MFEKKYDEHFAVDHCFKFRLRVIKLLPISGAFLAFCMVKSIEKWKSEMNQTITISNEPF